MIPKELHLRNILDTTIEELARLPNATAEEWALIDRAATVEGKARWDFLRWMIRYELRGTFGHKGKALREYWLTMGKQMALSGLWVAIMFHTRGVVNEAERRARYFAKLATEREHKDAVIESKRKVTEAERARALADAPACVLVSGDDLRAGMFLPYVVGRLVALREADLLDWRLIDRAAASRGVSWREFVAVEFVLWRIQLKGFVEGGSASWWHGSSVLWWRQSGDAAALTGTWLELNRRAVEVMQDDDSSLSLFSSTEEARAELMPIMETFAFGAAAAVDARDARCWKEAELAAWARKPSKLHSTTLLAHMVNELGQFKDEPGSDWREIEGAAAIKGKSWRAFIGWALIRHFIAYTGRCWWQAQVMTEIQRGEDFDLWAIVNQEARRVKQANATRSNIPAWLMG